MHEVGQYPKLERWIADHARQRGRGSYRGAAREWHTRVYEPVVQDASFKRVLRRFPTRSSGDVFVYLGDHKWIMSRAAGRDVGVPAALEDFERRLGRPGPRGFVRWLEDLTALVPRIARKTIRVARRGDGPRR